MDLRTETIGMSRFRQMYIVVSALPTILPMLTFVFWFMGSGGWNSEPADVSGPIVLVFGAAVLATVPLGLWLYYLVFASYTVFGWAIAYPRPAQVRQWYATLAGIQPPVAERQPGLL